MRFNRKKVPLVVIVGPTASGKTSIAVELAKLFQGEIISADSRQFYIGMNIGTAKPSSYELQQVPHHLINIAYPDQLVSLSEFKQLATTAIETIHSHNHIPFLVGGTGQYVKSIVEGWKIPPQTPDPELRFALEKWGEEIGSEALHQRLSRIDPEAAAIIQYQNRRRTIRALEVVFSTGRKFSEQRKKSPPPYSVLRIGIHRDRKELYSRIDERIDRMVESGLLKETRDLITSGYATNSPAFSAIGYKEMIDVLNGDITMEEAILLMKRRTREYVRRQANWFKMSDPDIIWLDATEDLEKHAVKIIQDFLRGKINFTRILEPEDSNE
jgi:tRNA dimethylallyltransferase